MHLILPPSETKRSGGGSVFSAENLAFDRELGKARRSVRTALVRVSKDEEGARAALKLGVKSLGERMHNLALDTSGAMPAIERYTGVLYDALDAPSLGSDERGWIDDHVLIQSALFGVIRSRDLIPAYRISASSRLASLPTPLGRYWSAAHGAIDWGAYADNASVPGDGWILDLRSLDYAALAPLPLGLASYLHVTQRSADGEVRALNHFNKAAKGMLVRMLAQSRPQLHSARQFQEWGASVGLEIELDPESSTVTLVLSEPNSPTATLNQ